MELKKHRLKPHILCCFSIFFFFFYYSVCAPFSATSSRTTCLDIKSQFSVKADLSFQEIEKSRDHEVIKNMGFSERQEGDALSLARRLLSGPGSSPPRCTSKCGNCTPCKPVHVPVPPGTPVTAEYYPEAWRCKCGNKLYMP